ncbi:hypothetical protein [Streptomyces deccanensis]|nr:hypothetical protein [Streptomyces deccanensis]ULR51016.1 hypothetical protein L3078_17880 [Streptomyces deccanensis]
MEMRHEECDHPMTVWAAKLCDRARDDHGECQHDMTHGEMNKCQRAQEKE